MGSERWLNIRVSAMVPLWQMSATPRSMARPDDLIGHHRHAVEEIDEAVAVRAEEGQVAGVAISSRVSRGPDSVPVSEKPALKQTKPPAPRAASARGDAGRFVIGHGDEGGIGSARQVRDRAIISGGGR